MFANRVLLLAATGGLSFVLAACAGVQPVAYSGIASSSQLQANHAGNSDRIPYDYSRQVDWSQYGKLVLDPVVVYRGSDAQFGKLSPADESALADYMGKTFGKRLSGRFALVGQPAAGTLRIRLTLTGAETTKPVIGQAMHFDIAGNLYNGVQAVRGGQGAFSGSVSYAVEIYDASSNQLLKAYVSKQYPNAMNLPAAFGSLAAARTGLDKGADALVAMLK
ncbi:MAG: DUF3313 domain-containing protein [Burkholderia sp.]